MEMRSRNTLIISIINIIIVIIIIIIIIIIDMSRIPDQIGVSQLYNMLEICTILVGNPQYVS